MIYVAFEMDCVLTSHSSILEFSCSHTHVVGSSLHTHPKLLNRLLMG